MRIDSLVSTQSESLSGQTVDQVSRVSGPSEINQSDSSEGFNPQKDQGRLGKILHLLEKAKEEKKRQERPLSQSKKLFDALKIYKNVAKSTNRDEAGGHLNVKV